MNKILFIILVLLLNSMALYSQNVQISGYVIDKESGEKLIHATVYCSKLKTGVVSNMYGFYSIPVPKNTNIQLVYNYVGYNTVIKNLSLNRDTVINIYLSSQNDLDTIVVRENRITKQSGYDHISIAQIKKVPTVIGESDALRIFTMRPGIQQGTEGSGHLHVRGGSPDQNLILLDDVPLYFTGHLGGIVSVFNTEAIKNIDVYKSGFPASYGGRLSSVIDIRTRDGNMKEWKTSINPGIISGNIMTEGPIIKDKLSLMFTARRGLLDFYTFLFYKVVLQLNENAGYIFNDANIKLNYIINDKNRLYFSMFNARDKVRYRFIDSYDNESQNEDTPWGTNLFSLRWNYLFSNKLFSNITLSASKYSFSNNLFYENTQNYYKTESGFESKIADKNLNIDFCWYANSNHTIKFGSQSSYHQVNAFSENKVNSEDTTYHDIYFSKSKSSIETALYIEDKIELLKKITLNLGLRVNGLFTDNLSYYRVLPRINLNYNIIKDLNLIASYQKNTQALHLLTNSPSGAPNEFWVTATDKIAPQYSEQYSGGINYQLAKSDIKFSVELYHKTMHNLIEIKEGMYDFNFIANWEENTDGGGTGTAYGIEFLIEKQSGKHSGWIAYTLSKSERQFETQNNGKPFPYKYDRPHYLNLVYVYNINKRMYLSAAWTYMSGVRMTLAEGYQRYNLYAKKIDVDRFYWLSDRPDFQYYKYSGKYDYQLPAVHHLDVSFSIEKQKKKGTAKWTFGVYNIYNRMNPYMIINDDDVIEGNYRVKMKQLTLFPLIPNFSYSYSF